MKGTVLYGPRDVRFEERDAPTIIETTDANIRLLATCMCGNDLWPDAPMESSKTGQIRKASVGWLCAGRIVTTLLVIAWSVLSAAPTWAADDTEQVVLTAHERRRAATLAGDVAALDSMMTDDLTFMHANAAVETKAEFLDALKTGRYKYQSLTDEEHRVRVHGDTGIVSGTCRILVTASGKDIDIRVGFTELWVKERGAWRMVLWQATQVP